ncbi:MAG TPA: DUF429 domain-containing protein [Actinomycetes bacterium]|nr:DUF429 domain-containing protein [Actinomycetes bacterium]
MRYLGVDLAWGPRATTGIAAVNASGELLHLAPVGPDDAIFALLRSWAPDACLIAFDAPLVVKNLTGKRDCERLVTKYFGGYNAGCHPSNLSMPHFAEGPRAMRICTELGLDFDPSSTSRRRAIEVYPHPAIVSLFNLSRIVQYKHKSGRSFEFLREESIRLIGMIESLQSAPVQLLVTAHPDWMSLRQSVEHATRKVELKRVEDCIDAVICAYVALLVDQAPDDLRVIGDMASGYIVTPVSAEVARAIDADGG